MSDKESSGSGSHSKHRRRRLSKLSACRSGTNVKDNRQSPIPDDLDSVHFLSCPKKIFDIISVFDVRKRTMIESIGFGGILSIPFVSDENKGFSLWLLNKMKWYYGTISVGDKFILTLTPEHIGNITGLTSSGIDICDNSLETVNEKLYFMKSRLSFLDNHSGIVQGAETFVQQELPCVLTNEVSDNFKIAFVIFLIGRFLAPSFDHPDGNTNFWGALQNPAEISSFNWSQYVLGNLKDAARLLNWVIPSGKTLRFVTGCMLILQIFYLDNINFGDLNLQNDVLPRWSIFSNDHLNAMIRADSIVPFPGSTKVTYGRIQEIRAVKSAYGVCQHPSVAPELEQSTDPVLAIAVGPTQNNVDEYSGPFLHSGSTMPTIFNRSHSFGNDVLDFAKFIRERYQGKVDINLLDDLKLHNARCLNHIYKSYRSMAASIVNENACLAQLILDHQLMKDDSSSSESLINSNIQRRRRYKDFLSGTESSTEGEDNTSNSKIHRARLPRGLAPQNNNFASTRAVQSIPEGSITSNSKGVIDVSQLMNLEVSASPRLKQSIGFGGNKSELNSSLSPLSGQSKPAATKENTTSGMLPIFRNTSTPKSYSSNHSFEGGFSTPVSTSTPAYMSVTKTSHSPTFCTPALLTMNSKVSENDSPDIETHKVQPLGFPHKFRVHQNPHGCIKMLPLSPHLSSTTKNNHISGACLSLKTLESKTEINLNSESLETEYKYDIHPIKVETAGRFPSSHWSKTVQLPQIDCSVASAFYDWLKTTTCKELNRNWLIHEIPRCIKLTGMDLQNQFAIKQPMTFDLFDITIRCLRQFDQYLYCSDTRLRWRHMLESDFAMHVLGDQDPLESKPIRDQFVGLPAKYEVSNCRMFYVPVFLNGLWWCYAWDLECRVVYIIDPSSCHEKEHEVMTRHVGTLEQLSKSLTAFVRHSYSGWQPPFLLCKPSILPTYVHHLHCNDSGFLTLFCIRHYDGEKLLMKLTEANLRMFKERLFYELMQMKGNSGHAPPFVQIIE